MSRTRLLASAMVISMLAMVVSLAPAGASAHKYNTVKISRIGSTSIASAAAATSQLADIGSFRQLPQRSVHADVAQRTPGTLTPPMPTPWSRTGRNPGFSGFAGLTHTDQRTANNGKQYSLEPPDQGLCVGPGGAPGAAAASGTTVMEAVNDVIRIYDGSGNALTGVVDVNTFFGLPAQIDRTAGTFGPFLSDPRCYRDPHNGHWYLSILEIAVDPSTGAFGTTSAELLAVSKTTSPLGSWFLYSIDTTNNSHPGCPCFGDQPLIGADASSFEVTTNEFPITGPGFNGAQVYAISKAKLAAGTATIAFTFSGLTLAEGTAYTLQPATTPPGAGYETGAKGTEFFLSALDFTSTLDNRIAVWALTGTSTIDNIVPALALTSSVMTSETYGQPPSGAQQKPGPTPLGSSLVPPEPLATVACNDDRMQATMFAHHGLYGALNTIAIMNGVPRCEIAYFQVTPSVKTGVAAGSVSKQGYVALKFNNVIYPTIAVNSVDDALMSFTIVGPGDWPSSGYADIEVGAITSVHTAAAGTAPEDGFTGYVAFGGAGVARWGDYSAAAVDDNGNLWLASEMIPSSPPRTTFANWGTFVSQVTSPPD